MDTEVNLDEQEAVAVEFVQGLLDALGVAGSVRTGRTEDEGIALDIDGDGLGLLVGPKGATLSALEELTRGGAARRRRTAGPPPRRRGRVPAAPSGGARRVHPEGRRRGRCVG